MWESMLRCLRVGPSEHVESVRLARNTRHIDLEIGQQGVWWNGRRHQVGRQRATRVVMIGQDWRRVFGSDDTEELGVPGTESSASDSKSGSRARATASQEVERERR